MAHVQESLGHGAETPAPQNAAAAGGWLDIGTLQGCYQQPDEDTLRSVVEYRRPHPVIPELGARGRAVALLILTPSRTASEPTTGAH